MKYRGQNKEVMRLKLNENFKRKWFLPLLVCLPVSPSLFAFELSLEPLVRAEDAEYYNRGEVLLGKQLFHDKRLSSDNSIACSSCHDVTSGGDDGRPVSLGVSDAPGNLNSPSVFNSQLSIAKFWDGRAADLEEQIEGPIHNPVEMNTSWKEIVSKLSNDREIVKQFEDLYSEGLTENNIIKTIVNYQRSLITFDAPFDRYLLGDADAVDESVKNGYSLFKNYGCIGCHQGKGVGGNMFQVFGVAGNFFSEREYVKKSDLGRFNVTGNIYDKFAFKVPSLRNVEQTAPYLHDGSIETLQGVIKIMAKYQLGRPISDSDVSDIEAFLKSLTGQIDEHLK